MLPDVCFDSVLIGEGLSTRNALEFLESQVRLNVQFVSRARGEMLRANVTLAWLLSCVDSPVFVQATGQGN